MKVYQLDFVTPGRLPREASARKQIRQIPNFLINARGLPHIGQRLYPLTLNLGCRNAFILSAFRAKSSSCERHRGDCPPTVIHGPTFLFPIQPGNRYTQLPPFLLPIQSGKRYRQFLKGMPNCFSSSLPSSSVLAVVTMVILSPFILSILS